MAAEASPTTTTTTTSSSNIIASDGHGLASDNVLVIECWARKEVQGAKLCSDVTKGHEDLVLPICLPCHLIPFLFFFAIEAGIVRGGKDGGRKGRGNRRRGGEEWHTLVGRCAWKREGGGREATNQPYTHSSYKYFLSFLHFVCLLHTYT